tara:strand:+ start:31621 stop:32091 length:471 start_codon:yes stop_codon:yes gene_type:complete
VRTALILILSLFTANICEAGPTKEITKGYVQNDEGEKCWYTQKFIDDVIYFSKKHTQNIGVITFDDPSCMSDNGLGLSAHKMMINNVISRWYSHDDANFQTNADELFSSSRLQIKGQCMQSKTYGMIGVLLDYKIEEDSIIQVTHSSSMGGCKNDL